MWHLLQLSDTLDAEFGSALGERVPIIAWKPARTWLPPFGRNPRAYEEPLVDPPLSVRTFPLLRGFSSGPGSVLARTGSTVVRYLLEQTPAPVSSPLVCTVPYFVPVAERWPGPVIYWLTDRMERYHDVNVPRIHALDRRMCEVAAMVCPNSNRLAEYLVQNGRCSENKLRIVPNATRASNLLPQTPSGSAFRPEDIRNVNRPIVGIIGNLASNTDWLLLLQMMQATPDFSWVFVGPTSMSIEDPQQREARRKATLEPNGRFIGRKPYGELAAYARAFDVAVLPYLRCEPTYSGSSTRFYEHLAACRPMLATRGFEELLHKEPLLTLFDDATQGIKLLKKLQASGFEDGFAHDRWEASQGSTWQARAAFVIDQFEHINLSAHDGWNHSLPNPANRLRSDSVA